MSAARLEGKVAIVTGAGSGIGRASAISLASAGAKVVVSDIDEVGGKETAAVIGESAHFVHSDVSDPDSVARLVAATIGRFDRLDIAHNNAGIGAAGVNLVDVDKRDWDKVIAIDLTGVFLCMRAQIPAMLMTGGGSVINTSSGTGLVGTTGQIAYVAAKHGVIGATRAAALEYATHGIRVNAIAPGVIATPAVAAVEADHPELVAQWAAGMPINRLAQPSEIGSVVAWLASDDASFVTGAVIAADGGYTAQ